MTYPNNTIQSYESKWWIKDEKRDFQTGRLIKCVLPHVHQVPWTLVAEGRTDDATDHSHIRYSMKELKLLEKKDLPTLPPAALTLPEGEKVLAYRGKKRPALIISSGGEVIHSDLTRGKPKWQTTPTVLVVPYYGVEEGQRAGYNKEFVKRVKMAEYPNFYWDQLPLPGGGAEGSICRLDHILPIGKHHDSVEFTQHCLSHEALGYIHEWVRWLFEGTMDPDGMLKLVREELLRIEKI